MVGRALLSSALAFSLVSSESNSLGSAQTSLQIPLGSLLDTLTHMCCFRIKELGTIDAGSGPVDKAGVGPVKAHLQISQETQGSWLSPHPSLTPGLLSWGLAITESLPRVTRQPH